MATVPAAAQPPAGLLDFLFGMRGDMPMDIQAALGLPGSARAADQLRMLTSQPAIRQTPFGTTIPMAPEERLAAQGLPPNGMAYEDYAIPGAAGQEAFMQGFGGRLLNPLGAPQQPQAKPAGVTIPMPGGPPTSGVTIPMPQAPDAPPGTPPVPLSQDALAKLPPGGLREMLSPTSVTVPLPGSPQNRAEYQAMRTEKVPFLSDMAAAGGAMQGGLDAFANAVSPTFQDARQYFTGIPATYSKDDAKTEALIGELLRPAPVPTRKPEPPTMPPSAVAGAPGMPGGGPMPPQGGAVPMRPGMPAPAAPPGMPAAGDPQMAMIEAAVGRMQNPAPDANGIVWNGPRQMGVGPAATPAQAATAPAASGDDERYRNLLEFGLRLMAGGDVKPGATSGPTFAGALGEAGFGTLTSNENRAIRRGTVARDERRHQEKMGLEREGLGIKREEVKETAALKRATLEQNARAKATENEISMMRVRMQELGLSVDRGTLMNSIGANRDRALKDVRDNNYIGDDEKKRLEADINSRYDAMEVQNGLRQPKQERSRTITEDHVKSLQAKYPDKSRDEIVKALRANGYTDG